MIEAPDANFQRANVIPERAAKEALINNLFVSRRLSIC
jgi:hypothetical protein